MNKLMNTRREFILALLSNIMAASALPALAVTNKSTVSKNKTGFVFDSTCMDHYMDPWHPESPERLARIITKVIETGLARKLTDVNPLKDNVAVQKAILNIHSWKHLVAVSDCKNTMDAAFQSVAAVLGAVHAVHEGKINNAFCAVRPPGHHAHNDVHLDGDCKGEGFCFYNSVAIAAKYLQKEFGYSRILIIDWDFHHGNGTEDIFYTDPSVLFFSTHDKNSYPGTGCPSRTGAGAGTGYNINVHLNCGATDQDIISAWQKQLLPAAEKFKPEFVLISAGFDSRVDDPLGCFSITDNGFKELTKISKQIASKHCNGRLVSALEGGYNLDGLTSAVISHLTALLN